MTEKQAKDYLFELWEDGILPNNFTEDHSNYEDALEFTMKNGYYYLYAEE